MPIRYGNKRINGIAILLLILNYVFPVSILAEDSGRILLEKNLKPIAVDVTTHLGDKQTFLKGDSISFLLSLDTDAHLLAFYEDAAGDLTQLIPNKKFNKTFYKAGLFIPLPDENAPFKFKVQAPYGKETLWLFVSDTHFPEVEGVYLDNGMKKITLDLAKIKSQLRNHKQTAFGATKLVIRTKDRN